MSTEITSLNKLFSIIEQCIILNPSYDLNTYIDLLHSYCGTDWLKYVKFNDNTYHRNIIYETNDIQIVIISWKPNQSSCIHDHPQRGCLLKILYGDVYEYKYKYTDTDTNADADANSAISLTNESKQPLLNYDKVRLLTGNISYQSHSDIHKISPNQHTVSLHIYSPGKYLPIKINE